MDASATKASGTFISIIKSHFFHFTRAEDHSANKPLVSTWAVSLKRFNGYTRTISFTVILSLRTVRNLSLKISFVNELSPLVLIDGDGYIKIADFGFSSNLIFPVWLN